MDDSEYDEMFSDSEMLDDLAEPEYSGIFLPSPQAPQTDSPGSPTMTRHASLDDLPEDDGMGLDDIGLEAIVAGEDTVMAKVEAVFEAMVDVLLNERDQFSLALMTRPPTSRSQHDAAGSKDPRSGSTQRICFPGKNEREAWRFTVVIRILELVHEALCKDVVLSKRDIYYRDPALFGKQSHVDRYVDNIAYTFGVTRASLNVIAAAKGLITGAVTFCRRDGTTVNTSSDREGLLMPNLKEILSADTSHVQWILVIEKEATFRSIAASDFWKTLCSSGIMVTAKGYPDISTRAMLHFLSTPSPQNSFTTLPVYGLVDYDPDGLAILSTYKHGSNNLAHETAHLRLPGMDWLGLRSGHVLGSKESHVEQGLLTLSTRDRKKARKMLEWEVLADDDGLKAELQTMLMLNIKAELQLLDATRNGMRDLLERSLPV